MAPILCGTSVAPPQQRAWQAAFIKQPNLLLLWLVTGEREPLGTRMCQVAAPASPCAARQGGVLNVLARGREKPRLPAPAGHTYAVKSPRPFHTRHPPANVPLPPGVPCRSRARHYAVRARSRARPGPRPRPWSVPNFFYFNNVVFSFLFYNYYLIIN